MIKILAGIIIVVLLLFFVKGIFQRESPPSATGNVIGEKSVTAEVKDGVQEVTLSWGKLNYSPEEVVVKKGIPLRITADLKRLKGCFRSFTIPAFRFTKVFTEGDNVIEFTPDKVGTFPFSCTMGMGRGKIVVVE